MSMRFPFAHFAVRQPIWTLQGRMDRPKPIVPVSLLGPLGTWVSDCFLDSGADETVFPDHLAGVVGIDLSNAPTGSASGVGKVPAVLRYAEATLRVQQGGEQREWLARVAFTTAALKRPLVGIAAFLQYFTTTLYGDLEE